MNTLYDLMVGLGGSVATVAIVVVIMISVILKLGKRNKIFMKVAQDTTAFIVVGDMLDQICPNVVDHRMSEMKDAEGRRWLIHEADEKKVLEVLFSNSLLGTIWFQMWLWKKFGIKFIGWWWINTVRHFFDIRSRKRLLEGAYVEMGASLKDRVVDSIDPETGEVETVVDSLLFLVPRPVYLDGIQLAGDNSRVNLLFQPIYQKVIPTLPVFSLKGDFFTQLDAAIEATVVHLSASHRVAVYKDGERKGQFANDFYNPPQAPKESETQEGYKKRKKEYEDTYESSHLTYAHWLKLAKAGEKSPLEMVLLNLNANSAYREELKKLGTEKDGKGQEIDNELVRELDRLTHSRLQKVEPELGEFPSGIIRRFGFALVSFRLVDWEPHVSTKPLAEALLAKETEAHIAQGVRQKADGEAYAREKVGIGESARYRELLAAQINMGVAEDVAADVLKTQVRTENIRDGKVVTYVEGGASTGVMVDGSK